MTDVPAMGYRGQIGFGASSPATFATEFESETIGTEKVILNASGIRGEKDTNYLHRMVEATREVKGGIELFPTQLFLDFFLEFIIGGTESGGPPLNTWLPIQADNPSFFMEIDRLTKVFQYTKCKVNTATFSGASGEILKLALDILGEVETVNAAGSAASLLPDLDTPFAFSDATLTLSGLPRFVSEITIVIDNKLLGGRFMNSTTLIDIPNAGFEVSGTLKFPYTSNNQDLYDLVGDITGAILKAEFESAGTAKYLQFLMQNVTISGDGTPKISGKEEEQFLELPFLANRVPGVTPVESLEIINALVKP